MFTIHSADQNKMQSMVFFVIQIFILIDVLNLDYQKNKK